MVVRVVEERPRLLHRVLVHVRAAGRDRRLSDPGRAVHFVGQDEAVPVDRRGFGERVPNLDADLIALNEAQPRPRHLPVEKYAST
jgi:hypothetical protein